MVFDFGTADDRVIPPIPQEEGLVYSLTVRTYSCPLVIARLPVDARESPSFPDPVTPLIPPVRPRPEKPGDNDDDEEFARKSEAHSAAVKNWMREKQKIEKRNVTLQGQRKQKLAEWVAWRERYETEEDTIVKEFYLQERTRLEREKQERERLARQQEQQEEDDGSDTNEDQSGAPSDKGEKTINNKRHFVDDSDDESPAKKQRVMLPPMASDAELETYEGKGFKRVEDECEYCRKKQFPCAMPIGKNGKFVAGSCRYCAKAHTKCTYGGGTRQEKKKSTSTVTDAPDDEEDNSTTASKTQRTPLPTKHSRSSSINGDIDLEGFVETVAGMTKRIAGSVHSQSRELDGIRADVSMNTAEIAGLRDSVERLTSVITSLLENVRRNNASAPNGRLDSECSNAGKAQPSEDGEEQMDVDQEHRSTKERDTDPARVEDTEKDNEQRDE
ncbi:hypothetical protein VNI00_008945 [Paramarasmius palmivorus]|uniref:Zn(2)-C6 fungal-type domain-containing protein n=1 Tax=Paramarasmius palmivorus TaxID=297713 RepID=A0AAW0CSK4_9AGAR